MRKPAIQSSSSSVLLSSSSPSLGSSLSAEVGFMVVVMNDIESSMIGVAVGKENLSGVVGMSVVGAVGGFVVGKRKTSVVFADAALGDLIGIFSVGRTMVVPSSDDAKDV